MSESETWHRERHRIKAKLDRQRRAQYSPKRSSWWLVLIALVLVAAALRFL